MRPRQLSFFVLMISVLFSFTVPASAASSGEQTPVITPLNAGKLDVLAVLAYGQSYDGDWSADGKLFFVASASGVWSYAFDDFAAPPKQFPLSSSSPVQAIAADPMGRYLATGHESGDINLWLSPDYTRAITLTGHNKTINDIAFSPDGKWLASSSTDGRVRLWDVTAHRTVYILHGHMPYPLVLAFSPDGKTLATAGGNPSEFGKLPAREIVKYPSISVKMQTNSSAVLLWDVKTGQRVGELTGFEHAVISMAYNADGTRLVAGGLEGKAIVWDVNSKKIIATQTTTATPYGINFTPDNTRILFSRPSFNTAENLQLIPTAIWAWDYNQKNSDLKTVIDHIGSPLSPWGLIETLRYSPNHRMLAAVSYQSVTFYNAETYNLIFDVPQEHHYLSSGGLHVLPTFSPDASMLVDFDYVTQQIVVWDTATQAERFRFPPQEQYGVFSFAFSQDSHLLAAGAGNGDIQVWDLQTREQVATLKGHVGRPATMVFSPDNRWLASSASNTNVAFDSDFTVRLWNIVSGTGEIIQTYPTTDVFFHVAGIAFTPDSRYVVMRDTNLGAHFYEVTTHRELNPSQISALEPLLQAEPPQSAFRREWYLAHYLDSHKTPWGFPVNLTPDHIHQFSEGYLALRGSSENDTVSVENLDTEQQQVELIGHSGEIQEKVFSPDGELIVTAAGSRMGGKHDNTLRLWETLTGKLLVTRTVSDTRDGIDSGIYALAYSPDGRYIVTSGDDGAIRLWGIPSES
ncbi:MAG: WD40 repeat domain-containing protein [Chloroflexota bacterium]